MLDMELDVQDAYPQRIRTRQTVCPPRIQTRQTRTRTWSRPTPRPSWFRYRKWTPYHDNHSSKGNRVHVTSGRRRRILCGTTPGAAYPGANWNACYSCGFDIPDRHTSQACPQHLRNGPRHPLHQAEYAAVHRPRVQLRHEELPQDGVPTDDVTFVVMVGNVAFKCNETFSLISTSSDPTHMFSPVSDLVVDDDDITVVTSNVSDGTTKSLELAFSLFAPWQESKWAMW